jgi:hypothetical protein
MPTDSQSPKSPQFPDPGTSGNNKSNATDPVLLSKADEQPSSTDSAAAGKEPVKDSKNTSPAPGDQLA